MSLASLGNVHAQQLKFLSTLHMSVNDWDSAMSTDNVFINFSK